MKTVIFDVGKKVDASSGEVLLYGTNIELGPVAKGKNEKEAFVRFEAALLSALRIQHQRKSKISNVEELDHLIFSEHYIVLRYEGGERKLRITV